MFGNVSDCLGLWYGERTGLGMTDILGFVRLRDDLSTIQERGNTRLSCQLLINQNRTIVDSKSQLYWFKDS